MHWKNLIFPLSTLVVFLSLGALFLAYSGPLPTDQVVSVLLGIAGFSLLLVQQLVVLRELVVVKKDGLNRFYTLHSFSACLLFTVALIHLISQKSSAYEVPSQPWTGLPGFLSLVLICLAILTGLFVLRGVLARFVPALEKFKEKFANREIALWLHRGTFLAMLLVFVHMLSIEFIRSNLAFVILASIYLLAIIGLYAWAWWRRWHLPRYVVNRVRHVSPEVYEIKLEPERGKLATYQPGQFVFLRFVKTKLPVEAHPFSISSDPASPAPTMTVHAKAVGDFTKRLGDLSAGDVALVEAFYGNFYPTDLTETEPLVLLAGGIGITPLRSIYLHSLKTSERPVHLLWSLAKAEENFLTKELRSLSRSNENFRSTITLTQESVEGTLHGRIDKTTLEEAGIMPLVDSARFLICGPPAFINAMQKLLSDVGVKKDQVKVEEFAL